jgi:hypothetical protein
MPNHIQPTDVLIDEYDETDDDAAEDFTFTLDAEGRLKSFSIPQHLMSELPEEVHMILELFGIEDIYELQDRTIH